jgi:hypothetical protein
MSPTSRRLVWALRLLAVALVGLHLAAPRLGEVNAWGLWPATVLPPAWRWGLALLVVAAVWAGPKLPVPRWRPPGPWARIGVALAAGVLFYLFRLRHLRWGDAYILVNAIPHPDVRLTYVWQAPLDVYLHARLWALGNAWFGWPDPMPVYWIIGALAGVAFVWTLLGLAAWLGRNTVERILIVGLIATLGTMQLFFGYVENYSIMTLGVLVYLWLALRALKGEVGLVWPAAALALTNAFHPSTLALAPSLLLLAWQRDRLGVEASRWRALAGLIVPYALVGAGVLALMTAGGHGLDALAGADYPGGGDRRWFVPLFTVQTRWEHYTMFSLGHLADIVNQQLLVAPVIWPGLILCAALAGWRVPWRDPAFRLLAAMAGGYLLLILTWNPDYGGQRDWDLFAPAAAPAAALLAYVLPRALPEVEALWAAAWALIPVQGFHTAAWVYQNTLPWEWPDSGG